MSTIQNYRPDIDGMRALAVTAVVLFHAGFGFLTGGYVGVDVFFVISGYLITSIIYREIDSGRFSFKRFWVRRARRLLPAATLVMLATMAGFLFYYPVSYFKEFGLSLSAQSIFSANIFFWKHSGYFGLAAETKPLLHTWSLSVEEQFYLFFPVLIFLIYKYVRSTLFFVVAFLTLASFFLSIWATYHFPNPAFYLLPTRAWELGVGAIIALRLTQWRIENPVIVNGVALMGLVAIVFAMLVYSEDTPFPSYTAALPVIGAAALIWSGNQSITWLAKGLSFKPIVWIGLISYPLYLWHWPVNVFANWIFFEEKNSVYYLVVLVLPVFLAALTYYLIEHPIRFRKSLFGDRFVVVGGVTSTALLFFIGLAAYKWGNGAIVDPGGVVDNYYKNATEHEPNRKECAHEGYSGGKVVVCEHQGNSAKATPDFFVWGDSHGSALIPGVVHYADAAKLNFHYMTVAGCQPFYNMKRLNQAFCEKVSDQAIAQIKQSQYKVVFLVGSFVNNLSYGRWRALDAPNEYDVSASIREFSQNFKMTVETIQSTGAQVVVFTEPPRQVENPVSDHMKRALFNKPERTYADRAGHIERIMPIYELIDAANIEKRLDYTSYFCGEVDCYHRKNGNSLYKDESHISNYAARQLAQFFMQDLSPMLQESKDM